VCNLCNPCTKEKGKGKILKIEEIREKIRRKEFKITDYAYWRCRQRKIKFKDVERWIKGKIRRR